MISNLPYQVGGSLIASAPSYVERKADSDLYAALKLGTFCYVLNSRQMGKSSLLVRTMHRLQQEEFRCTTVDITSIGSEQTTVSQWYRGVVADLWRGFKLIGKINYKSWWQEQENLSDLQKLHHFIRDVLLVQFPDEPIVIFIDEIDSILSLKFPLDDFFALIRFCYNQRAIDPEYKRLTFAIFGVAAPFDLIRDRKRTPFNIGKAIELQGFQFEESRQLLEGLATHIENAEAVLREILWWTNGQPFLTQKLCDHVWHLSQDAAEKKLTIPPGTEPAWAERLVRDRIINKWESQDEPEHLRTIRDRLLSNEQRAGRLLGIYQKILHNIEVIADDSREQIELILSGLVVKHDHALHVKNRIYQEVFDRSWVEYQLNYLRPYAPALDAWMASDGHDGSRLLRGQALQDAQQWARSKSLSDTDYQFLAVSQESDRREAQQALEAARLQEVEAKLSEEQKRLYAEHQNLLHVRNTARLQRSLLWVVGFAFVVASAIGGVAFWQYRQASISEIQALVSSSQGQFASNHQLEAMIDAVKAKRRSQSLGFDTRTNANLTAQINTVLGQTIYGTHELNRLVGHQASVLAVDISSDAQRIATGSNDKTIKIWKRDGTLLKTLQQQATVYDLAFSPDDRSIISGGLDGSVTLWKTDGTLINTWQAHPVPVWGVAVSSNGRLIASASGDQTVKLWSVSDARNRQPVPLQTIQTEQSTVWSVAFSPDQQILATAGDNTVKLWNLQGKLLKTLEGHQDLVWKVVFCPQSHQLISASSDRTAKIWSRDGVLIRTLEADDIVKGVDCSKDGQTIATSHQDGVINLWKPDGTSIGILRGHLSSAWDVALSDDGAIVASSGSESITRLWQRDNSFSRQLDVAKAPVYRITVSPDNQLMLAASEDGILQLWHTDGTLLQELPNAGEPSDFSADGRKLVSVMPSAINLFQLNRTDRSQLKLLKTFSAHQAAIISATISPDGNIIASAGDDKRINLWDVDGKLLHSSLAYNDRIWKVVFTGDGHHLVSSGADGVVKVWTIEGKEQQIHLRPTATIEAHVGSVWSMSVSPQNNLIATTGLDDTLKLWTLDGTLVKTIQGQGHGVTKVAFHPTGQIIATGDMNGTVKLWNLEGQLLKALPGYQPFVTGLSFTPDGKQLFSSGTNGTILLWDLERIRTLNEFEYACHWLHDYLQTNVESKSSNNTGLCNRFG